MDKVDFWIGCTYGPASNERIAISDWQTKEYIDLNSSYDFCFKKVKTIVEDVFNCKSWAVVRVKEAQLSYIKYEIRLYDSVYEMATIQFYYTVYSGGK